MGRAQDLFDRAVKSYDRAIDLIKTMDTVFQQAQKKSDSSFKGWDTKITLAQFDWILQGILLSGALADGNFDRLERQFVDKITDYGDLMAYIKKQTNGELELTWDNVAGLSADVQQKLLAILPGLMEKTCDSFVQPLAIVDNAIESRNFLDEIVKCIGEIGAYLSNVDGKSETREAEACGQMAVELLVERWNRMAGN